MYSAPVPVRLCSQGPQVGGITCQGRCSYEPIVANTHRAAGGGHSSPAKGSGKAPLTKRFKNHKCTTRFPEDKNQADGAKGKTAVS